MKKRIISWFLIFVMCLSVLAGKDITFASENTNYGSGVIVNPLHEELNIAVPDQSGQITEDVGEKLDASRTVYATEDEAADYLKKQMAKRAPSITVTVKYDYTTTSAELVTQSVFYKAIAYSEDCTGQEGDALAASCGGTSYSYYYDYTQAEITYTPNYYTTAAQEAELTTAVNAALQTLNLNGKSDYEKVRAIHDYICDHVDYDYENLANNPNYIPMYTAYAALCNGKAVCQGYAVLFYRMCKDAGLSVRFISGYGNGGSHAWNIVKVGNAYYNIDSTWDGQDVETRHTYFLQNTEDFAGHVRSNEYETTAFHAQFPMASDSWEDYSTLAEVLGVNNIASFNYTTIDEQTVTNQASGRGKVLVFGNTGCGYTRATISNLSSADFSDVDLIYVDAYKNTKADVTSFRDTYGSTTSNMIYTYNLNGTNMWSYVYLLMGNDTNRISFPFIVYIDGNNKVKGYQVAGTKSATSVRENINAFFGNVNLIGLSNSSLTMKVYEKSKLDVAVRGTIRNPQFFTWTSSNPNIATVDANGNIIGKAEGTTIITCKANDNVYATCNVTVSGVKEIPVPTKPYNIVNTVSGVHVYWNAVAGATKYGLWRSETGANGTYKWIANPTTYHFTDTKVESGKTYHYKVSVLDTDINIHGNLSPSIGIAYTSTPDITSRFNKAAGVQLGWNKIQGATGYRIYRKSYSGNDAWAKIAEIKGGDTTSYIDGSVKGKNGSIYKYTIRALKGTTLSGCRNAGRTMVRLASRVLNSATKASGTAIKCKWTTSSAVTGYEVRFMVGTNVYKTVTIGNYKTGTKTFTGLKAGQTYKIQVRAYKKVDGVGSFYSAWSTAKNVSL